MDRINIFQSLVLLLLVAMTLGQELDANTVEPLISRLNSFSCLDYLARDL